MRILACSALLTALAAPLSAAELPFTQVYGNEVGCLSIDEQSSEVDLELFHRLTATGLSWYESACQFLEVLPVSSESVEAASAWVAVSSCSSEGQHWPAMHLITLSADKSVAYFVGIESWDEGGDQRQVDKAPDRLNRCPPAQKPRPRVTLSPAENSRLQLNSDLPFIGNWAEDLNGCDSPGFRFNADGYAVSGQDFSRFTKLVGGENTIVEGGIGVDYNMTFPDGYSISLLNVTTTSMTWHSLATGDTFDLVRCPSASPPRPKP